MTASLAGVTRPCYIHTRQRDLCLSVELDCCNVANCGLITIVHHNQQSVFSKPKGSLARAVIPVEAPRTAGQGAFQECGNPLRRAGWRRHEEIRRPLRGLYGASAPPDWRSSPAKQRLNRSERGTWLAAMAAPPLAGRHPVPLLELRAKRRGGVANMPSDIGDAVFPVLAQ